MRLLGVLPDRPEVEADLLLMLEIIDRLHAPSAQKVRNFYQQRADDKERDSRDAEQRRLDAMKMHPCVCGRTIRGNAFTQHVRACKVAQNKDAPPKRARMKT